MRAPIIWLIAICFFLLPPRGASWDGGLRSHGLARHLHRTNDVGVACAAAQVAFETLSDFGFRRFRVALQQRGGGHEKARRAKTALQAVLVPEGLLERGELAVGGQA